MSDLDELQGSHLCLQKMASWGLASLLEGKVTLFLRVGADLPRLDEDEPRQASASLFALSAKASVALLHLDTVKGSKLLWKIKLSWHFMRASLHLF